MARVKGNKQPVTKTIKAGLRTAFPTSIEPMLATKIAQPFNDPDWLYEIKWDGYRIIAHVEHSKTTLHSRSLQNYTSLYPPIAEELAKFKRDMILDGEIVVLNKDGLPEFEALQNYSEGDSVIYYVFDLLWYNGKSLLALSLMERKKLLRDILPESSLIRYNDHFDDGIALFDKTRELGLEGIICKKKDSIYRPGTRTKDWLKLPSIKRQEFVIGGWTESGSGRAFRSILFGAYQNGKLINVGHAGSGYKDKVMKEIMTRLKKLESKKNPFGNKVETETKAHWIKPELVAEFKYSGYTRSGKIRKPAIFLGFRNDKNPKEVTIETATDPSSIVEKKDKERITSADSNWPKVESQKITSKEDFEIDDCRIELTNIEKQLWPEVTKAKLIEYYNDVAKFILPHIKGRPQSLHLKLAGPMTPGQYIKDMEGRQPSCAEIFQVKRKHKKAGKNEVIDYLVCNNRATLLWMINLGCIDVNPWTSRVHDYLHPDFIIIDLDPSDKDFSKAVETAKAAKDFFDQHRLKAFIKTSGKTGIHLYLPCRGFDFPAARSIAVNICSTIHQLVPSITTTEVSISNRGDKLYIDPNQNDEADTVAAPYSVRPYHVPIISTPLDWKEVNNTLDALQFTMDRIFKRLNKKGDLWTKVMDENIAQQNAKRLNSFIG